MTLFTSPAPPIPNRSSSEAMPVAVDDSWSANPYQVTDPRHRDHAQNQRQWQRSVTMGRIGVDRAMELRTSDFVRDAARNVRQEEQPSLTAALRHPHPSRLSSPASHVERVNSEAGLTCHLAMQGGALLWLFSKDGKLRVVNGFTGDEQHVADVNTPVDSNDEEMAAGSHRRLRNDREGPQDTAATAQRHATAAAVLDDSTYVAVVLSDGAVRIFDALTIAPVTEGSLGDLASPTAPLAILPLATQSNPITFIVVQAESVVVMALDFPADRRARLQLCVERHRSYQKRGMVITSGSLDTLRTLLYVGDASGHLWWIDVADLMLVDAVRVGAEPTQDEGGAEAVTSVTAARGLIICGTSRGRAQVYLRQPFGERPLLVMDEHALESAVVSVVYDPRNNSAWFISKRGGVCNWSMEDHTERFATRVTGGGAVAGVTVVPHTIASKLWAVTTSGINSVFIAESHACNEDMEITRGQMADVLSVQSATVEEKDGEVREAEATAQQRSQAIVRALEGAAKSALARDFFLKWVAFRSKKVTRRSHHDGAEVLGLLHDFRVARAYYLMWVGSMNRSRARKQSHATIQQLMRQRNDELSSRYFTLLMKFVKTRRIAAHNEIVAQRVATGNAAATRQQHMNGAWRLFVDNHRQKRDIQRYVERLGHLAQQVTIGVYYSKWRRIFCDGALTRKKAAIAAALARRVHMSQSLAYYQQWMSRVRRKRSTEMQTRWMGVMCSALDSVSMRRAFDRLAQFRVAKRRDREAGEVATASDRHRTVAEGYAAVAPKADRAKRVAELQARIAELKAQKAALCSDEDAINAHNQALRQTTSGDTGAVAGRGKVIVAVGRLRAKCFDLATDATLIARLLAKVKGDAPKQFAIATSDLRRVLCDELGAASEDGTWPLGTTDIAVRQSVLRFNVQGQTFLLQTLRSMIVAFDCLPTHEIDAADTAELVTNGYNLCVLAENLQILAAKRKSAPRAM